MEKTKRVRRTKEQIEADKLKESVNIEDVQDAEEEAIQAETEEEIDEEVKQGHIIINGLELPLKDGKRYLILNSGSPVYWTKQTADVMFSSTNLKLSVPKGSEYLAPKQQNCSTCG